MQVRDIPSAEIESMANLIPSPQFPQSPQPSEVTGLIRRRRRQKHRNSPSAILLGRNLEPLPRTPDSPSTPTPDAESVGRKRPASLLREGALLRPARSPSSTWFGTSSLYFFIHRLGVFLSTEVEHDQPDHMLLRSGRSAPPGSRLPTVVGDASRLLRPLADHASRGVYLNSIQEEFFVNLFWQTYHTSVFAIVNEAEFKKAYQALYVDVPPGHVRKPSALVDIVVAMCMQYGASTMPSGCQGRIVEDNDSTIAGRWHYRRAQALLAGEMESPTISTLQCHLLSALYVCGASFHNMADNIGGLAVRTAYMLGLHIDPSPTMAEAERQHRRRLWWAVYLLDSKIGMKLGRPFLLHSSSHAMPQLPDDQLGTSVLSGSTFAPIASNATWLSFSLHQLNLFRTVRAAHTALYSQDYGLTVDKTMWDDASSLEKAACQLSSHTLALDKWAENVPDALKTHRETQGCPLSTDGTALIFEQYAPLWLQRQRLLLELEYHHMCGNLFRPFVSFGSEPSQGSLAEAMAIRSVDHAIALSKITLQALSSTAILDGWHEAFQWQWNAAITLAGFILASPSHPSASPARNALDLTLSVFDTFGASFGTAANAAVVVRMLCEKIDIAASMSRSNASWDASEAASNDVPTGHGDSSTGDGFPDRMVDGSMDSLSTFGGQGFDFLQLAVGVDSWADMGMFGLGDLSLPVEVSTQGNN
ncbi:Thiamine repressible genes regulatory protein thi1 [Colletotrichum higginsianum IMI 349063]|uniref:Thiamine repressible genes regulatory protein thi1 n=1 Tax=Colletotrichum higginsianum (strain IMI 349063) TaxID=759273 RepID=A0A1B7YLW7_COLHI|nr:Thiamine repressible genes regulatory protein thi1 [Colletotrichum higginsianum IMI 349063]OBR13035.1 Thiamine repressible genes regulatory protein thi1 [Colletotrichum higginsianum IMI 349063]